jgi:hypothetical protein
MVDNFTRQQRMNNLSHVTSKIFFEIKVQKLHLKNIMYGLRQNHAY